MEKLIPILWTKSFIIIVISLNLISQITLAQESSNKNLIAKAVDKHGKFFLYEKDITSVSIGVFYNGEMYTQHFGELEKGKGNTPTNETMYEIASVSKTMTGYLVAKGVLEGKLKLEADVRMYLKESYLNLAYNGKPVTIKHLITHTSGIPMFLPIEMNGVFKKLDENVPNEYYRIEKDYDKEKFLADLKNVHLTVEPGTKFSYSNAGAELIGYILETVYEKTISELLKECILDTYHMANTAIVLNDAQNKKLAHGYWMNNITSSPDQLNKLWSTASGIKMDLTDMMLYMELQLTRKNSIVAESHKVLYEEGKLLKLAYFWRVWNDKYGRSYNHHGGTTGTQNWLYIFPDHKVGISIITNQSGPKTPNILSSAVKKILKDLIKT